MPVIPNRDSERLWLDPEVTDVQAALPLQQPYAPELISAWAVSRRVNSVANDSPDLIVPG